MYIVVRNHLGLQRYWTGATWPETGEPAFTGNYALVLPSGFFATAEAARAAIAERAPSIALGAYAVIPAEERDIPAKAEPFEGAEPLTRFPWQGSAAG